MYLSVNDFFSKYLTMIDGKLENCQIIVVSKDIIANEYIEENGVKIYKSSYDSVDFTPELYPNSRVMEYRLSSTMKSYADMYIQQLEGLEQCRVICSIIDLVINENMNVILLCSKVDLKVQHFDIMRDFMFDKFGVVMHSFEEYLENPDCLNDCGDFETARLMLQFQIENMKLIDENIGVFFNQFTKDMAEQYRQILMNKSIDELCEIGIRNNIHVNRRKPKEYNVDHIMQKLLPSAANEELPWRQ